MPLGIYCKKYRSLLQETVLAGVGPKSQDNGEEEEEFVEHTELLTRMPITN